MKKPTETDILKAQLKTVINGRDRALNEIDELKKQAAERDLTIASNGTTIQTQRQSISTLKRAIADLEKSLADANGYIRAIQDRALADSPIIEVPQPPIMTTRAHVLHRDGFSTRTSPMGFEPSYTERDEYGRERPARKHWTEL